MEAVALIVAGEFEYSMAGKRNGEVVSIDALRRDFTSHTPKTANFRVATSATFLGVAVADAAARSFSAEAQASQHRSIACCA